MNDRFSITRNTTLRVLLTMSCLLSCERDTAAPASATPPVFDQDSSFKLLPRITITQLDQWLGFPLHNPNQFKALHARNSAHAPEQYDRKLSRCSARWSEFSRVVFMDWPEQGAESVASFYMLDGRVEIIALKIYEIYSHEPPSLWDKTRQFLGFESASQNDVQQLKLKDMSNALQPLDSLAKSTCTTTTFKDKEIGYQCKTFALSEFGDGPVAGIGNSFHMLRLEELDSYMDILSHFDKPSSPMYVQHELCDGCYGRHLFIYRDTQMLTSYLKALTHDTSTRCHP